MGLVFTQKPPKKPNCREHTVRQFFDSSFYFGLFEPQHRASSSHIPFTTGDFLVNHQEITKLKFENSPHFHNSHITLSLQPYALLISESLEAISHLSTLFSGFYRKSTSPTDH
jgi:hypothetical protein